MNIIQKPEWLLYAEQVRAWIDKMKPTKDGKREAEAIYRAWLEATRTMAYEGSEHDWQLQNLGKVRRNIGLKRRA